MIATFYDFKGFCANILAYVFLNYGSRFLWFFMFWEGNSREGKASFFKNEKAEKHTKILKLETVTYSNAAPDAMQNKCT